MNDFDDLLVSQEHRIIDRQAAGVLFGVGGGDFETVEQGIGGIWL